jgi:outer membrane protein
MANFPRASHVAAWCGAAVLCGLSASAVRAETLADAIAFAYRTNPALQGERATQRAGDEAYVQARAGFRPTVSLDAAALRSDSPLALLGQVNVSGVALSVTQPLYTGGRASSQVTAAAAGLAAGRQGLRDAEQTVLLAVVEAYVDVRRDQQSLAISQDNLQVLRRQLAEANDRLKVKDVTRTDVAQTEARVAAAEARVASAEAELAISRANYLEVVGRDAGDLAPEPSIAALLPPDLNQAFDIAERHNPSVLQSEAAEQSAAALTAAARANARPTVSLRANLGYSGGGLQGASPFANYGRFDSVAVVASIPLFSGGVIASQVRQAAERDQAAHAAIDLARRKAVGSVSRAWNQLLGARANLVADQSQVRAAAVALEGTRQEAQVGVRTILDVLNAEQELRNAELAVVGARRDEYLATALVLAATGSLDVSALAPGEAPYEPKTNGDLQRSGGAVPWEGAVEAVDRLGAGRAK